MRPLFGGALSTIVPEEFQDISLIRQVPDTQEVFADATTDRSVIIELLEREKEIGDDDIALHCFKDIVDTSGASWHSARLCLGVCV